MDRQVRILSLQILGRPEKPAFKISDLGERRTEDRVHSAKILRQVSSRASSFSIYQFPFLIYHLVFTQPELGKQRMSYSSLRKHRASHLHGLAQKVRRDQLQYRERSDRMSDSIFPCDYHDRVVEETSGRFA